jgi:D-beta-D-heptose 7-phosphate kinase / D-beta-D-heptose 1-phosphate adenosyltransferase
MGKIIDEHEISAEAKNQRKLGNKIVLVGGCFDILHQGHLLFLEQAKKENEVLFLILESDENIKLKKGKNRPINTQKHREKVLSHLPNVDFIIPLTGVTKDEEYDRPDIVAMTIGDKATDKRKEQCEKFGAILRIIERVGELSTTAIINKNLKL